MKKPKTRRVKSKQIEQWIQEGRAILRNDLIPEDLQGWPDNYYLFDNVGLIIRDTIEKKDGIHYEEYSEFLTFMNAGRERIKRAEQTPYIKDATFPSYLKISFGEFDALVPQSAKQLEEAFSLKKGSMDYSIESLKPLGNAIKKILKEFDSGDFEDKYLVPITAYCGEVMRREINGEWKVNADAEGMIIQVLIVEKGNAEYSYRPEMPLVLILSGDAPSGSNLQIEVKAQLGKYGFIKGNEEHYGIKP